VSYNVSRWGENPLEMGRKPPFPLSGGISFWDKNPPYFSLQILRGKQNNLVKTHIEWPKQKRKAAGSLNEIPCPEKRKGERNEKTLEKNFFERKSQRILTNLFAPK